jgi:hypothetical protein
MIGGMAEDGHPTEARFRHRRLHSGRPELRRNPGQRSRGARAPVRRQGHGGVTPAFRAAVFKRFRGLETKNLPEARCGQWGKGLTAAEMEKCRWLKPRVVATIDYLKRTAANHLRHAMFPDLSTPQDTT